MSKSNGKAVGPRVKASKVVSKPRKSLFSGTKREMETQAERSRAGSKQVSRWGREGKAYIYIYLLHI